MSVKHYSLTETAKLIRQALKAAFPLTKFSVRSKSYSGGCSITTCWTDGPTTKQVDAIQKHFQGASFDGMIDLKSYNAPSEWNGERVTFAPDFVFTSRGQSRAAMIEAVEWVAGHANATAQTVTDGPYPHIEGWGQSLPYSFFITDDGKSALAHNSHRSESANQLAMMYCYARSYEANAAQPDGPSYVTDEYINAKVEAMLAGVN